jgi:nitrite reductase (NADH) small subunit
MTMIDKAWIDIGGLADIPRQGARVVRTGRGCIAVFRTADDGVFALDDRCPHKGGPLSEGIVHGQSVTCPLHNWVISLATGKAEGADDGRVAAHRLKVEGGRILLEAAALAPAAD